LADLQLHTAALPIEQWLELRAQRRPAIQQAADESRLQLAALGEVVFQLVAEAGQAVQAVDGGAALERVQPALQLRHVASGPDIFEQRAHFGAELDEAGTIVEQPSKQPRELALVGLCALALELRRAVRDHDQHAVEGSGLEMDRAILDLQHAFCDAQPLG
jgi:hypothetical protein